MHEYDQVFAMEDEVEEEVVGATEDELDEDELEDEDEVVAPVVEEEEI